MKDPDSSPTSPPKLQLQQLSQQQLLRQHGGTGMLLWVLWLTYGSFYFCRTNISAALPGILSEFGYEKAEMGMVLAALKLAYGIGQFVNGQLSERYSPRKMLAIGMLVSAGLNVLFGFATGLYFFLFIWACNGYFQAFGWTPTMRVAANWLPPAVRGRGVGIIGTGYMVSAAVTYVVAGASAEHFGWRGAFFIPAVLLVASSLHMLLFLREMPAGASVESQVQKETAGEGAKRGSVLGNVWITLGNPSLWFLAVSLGLLNANRYGFLDWGLTHIKEVQDTGVGKAALKYMVLPLGGIAGAYVSGWFTDRFLGGRRAPMICALLVVLGALTLVYNQVVHLGMVPTVITLFFIGFVIYGPQVLLVGTAPMDLARRGTAAAAVGFVNFMGYMGAFAGDLVTGYVVDEKGWETAVFVWASWAFLAALSVALLWNVTAARSLGGSDTKERGGEES